MKLKGELETHFGKEDPREDLVQGSICLKIASN
jgi:hypothetical protein